MIKYIIIDVDGTLTDGGIYYDEHGNELKKFCTRDAAGFFTAKAAGITVIVLTGRECAATTRRLSELGVALYQGVKDKAEWIQEWMKKNIISKNDVGYIGDDINDLASMKLCGYVGCPLDSCAEIKELASYISPIKGGQGAVRDIIEHYLREQRLWNKLIETVYKTSGY